MSPSPNKTIVAFYWLLVLICVGIGGWIVWGALA